MLGPCLVICLADLCFSIFVLFLFLFLVLNNPSFFCFFVDLFVVFFSFHFLPFPFVFDRECFAPSLLACRECCKLSSWAVSSLCEALFRWGRLIGNQGSTVHMYDGMLLGHIWGLSPPRGDFKIKNGMHLCSGFLAGNQIPKSIRRLLIHSERPTMSLVVAFWHGV